MNWATLVGVLGIIAGGIFFFRQSDTRKSAPSGHAPPIIRRVAAEFPNAVFYKKTDQKVVALTIDDIPAQPDKDDLATQMIVQEIAHFNAGLSPDAAPVRATFFVISSHLSDDNTIISKIAEEGHEIGNHGDVDETTALLASDEFERQLTASDARIRKFYRQPIRWYRPGRGVFTDNMTAALRRMPTYEARFALASMLPIDTFWPTDSPEFTAWHVEQNIFPGAILVIHGGPLQRSQRTVRALDLILNHLYQNGYRAVTLSDLMDNY